MVIPILSPIPSFARNGFYQPASGGLVLRDFRMRLVENRIPQVTHFCLKSQFGD